MILARPVPKVLRIVDYADVRGKGSYTDEADSKDEAD
jgi:hypothetical protein